MSSYSNLRKAMTKAFVTSGILPKSKIRFENQKFEEPATGTFAELYFIPVGITRATLGPCGTDERHCIFQITLKSPALKGPDEIESFVDPIVSYFPSGKSFVYEGTSVTILRSAEPSSTSVVDGKYTVNISIEFYSTLPRNNPNQN
jgi:hypothetical protein